MIAALWCSGWEYSTRRYLKGFSDAIVPHTATPVQKIQAILGWISRTQSRFQQAPAAMADDRDPTDTLNYASLLSVCGTATNAFLNVADAAGLTTRRLLLLDANRSTVHVVAEVFLDGRWIVVDPAFHTILRGPDGGMLTSAELSDPAIFRGATEKIPGYDPSYVFTRTVHIRLSHFGVIGRGLRRILGTPNWEGSPFVSLIVERKSLEMTFLFGMFAVFLALLRTLLGWYGKFRLGIRRERLHRKAPNLFAVPAD